MTTGLYTCLHIYRPLWNIPSDLKLFIPRELISSRHYGDGRCKYSSQWGSVDIRPHVNKGFPFILLWQPDCIHVYIFIARCDIFRLNLNGSIFLKIFSPPWGSVDNQAPALWGTIDIRPHVNKGFPFIWLLQLVCILFLHILSPVVKNSAWT